MTNDRPSRVRWRILGLLFLISLVTYIDRVNIAGGAFLESLLWLGVKFDKRGAGKKGF